jgi:hypothetical protein
MEQLVGEVRIVLHVVTPRHRSGSKHAFAEPLLVYRQNGRGENGERVPRHAVRGNWDEHALLALNEVHRRRLGPGKSSDLTGHEAKRPGEVRLSRQDAGNLDQDIVAAHVDVSREIVRQSSGCSRSSTTMKK